MKLFQTNKDAFVGSPEAITEFSVNLRSLQCSLTCVRRRSNKQICVKDFILCDDKQHCESGEDEEPAVCQSLNKVWILFHLKNKYAFLVSVNEERPNHPSLGGVASQGGGGGQLARWGSVSQGGGGGSSTPTHTWLHLAYSTYSRTWPKTEKNNWKENKQKQLTACDQVQQACHSQERFLFTPTGVDPKSIQDFGQGGSWVLTPWGC